MFIKHYKVSEYGYDEYFKFKVSKTSQGSSHQFEPGNFIISLTVWNRCVYIGREWFN